MMTFWKPGRPKADMAEKSLPCRVLRPRHRAEPPLNRPRFLIAIGVFCAVYAVIGGRLVTWGAMPQTPGLAASAAEGGRPDLLDRNGEVLATDIRSASLFAEPRRIADAGKVGKALMGVLPGLDRKFLQARLSEKSSFAWIKRDVTPAQMRAIEALGIAGIGFRTEKRRFYPGGKTAAHLVGLVNADNRGVAGMEKYVDGLAGRTPQEGGGLPPVRLSVDLRVQHVLRDELALAMDKYKAAAAGAVMLDIRTGEVLAMASLPDFDPNTPGDAVEPGSANRMSAGTFEMGSTFAAFTTAMALDSGRMQAGDTFDARAPIRIEGFSISDPQGQNRVLSVPEIFVYSSNVGTAQQARLVGAAQHKAFLGRLGLLDPMRTELPEVASPIQPREWKTINSITAALGHGVSTTPLQTAVAAAALINGGYLVEPTFLPRSKAAAEALRHRVVSDATSADMRDLFRLGGEKGPGRVANVDGYDLGGKTGTAEKVDGGRYQSGKRLNVYLGAFPMNNPRYVVLAMLDEPHPAPGQPYATAGWNVAPMAAAIVRRSARYLDVRPDFGNKGPQLLVSY